MGVTELDSHKYDRLLFSPLKTDLILLFLIRIVSVTEIIITRVAGYLCLYSVLTKKLISNPHYIFLMKGFSYSVGVSPKENT